MSLVQEGQTSVIQSPYYKEPENHSGESTGGFLRGDFRLTRKDRVMFYFFGRLLNPVGEPQEEPKP
jgi:hypothetical protein